jgi:type III pantothenate kinase
VVDEKFDLGISHSYEPPSALGTDRLLAAAAAAEIYGLPCIVCSFGTATTIDAVNSEGNFLGGTISPGMKTMADALHLRASKLPKVEIEKPERVIANTTVGSTRSGIFYGCLGMVEGLIARIMQEAGGIPKVIATGGFARLIAENSDLISVADEDLVLKGLQIVFKRRASAAMPEASGPLSPARTRTLS